MGLLIETCRKCLIWWRKFSIWTRTSCARTDSVTSWTKTPWVQYQPHAVNVLTQPQYYITFEQNLFDSRLLDHDLVQQLGIKEDKESGVDMPGPSQLLTSPPSKGSIGRAASLNTHTTLPTLSFHSYHQEEGSGDWNTMTTRFRNIFFPTTMGREHHTTLTSATVIPFVFVALLWLPSIMVIHLLYFWLLNIVCVLFHLWAC